MTKSVFNLKLVAPLAAAIISVNTGAQEASKEEIGELMETIVVTAQAANARSDIQRQRDSDKMIAVQTSDAIGELPDANVTEALQRMPGVFITRDQGEGRFVGVRGIDPNLNSATINGMALPAPESDSRAVAMDVIPSDLLASLEVSKTLTPDMSADSIGGAIEIKSINALDHDGQNFKLSVENSYSELQDENSPKVAGKFTNVFELDGGAELGVAIAGSHQERNFGSENIETDGAWEMMEAEDGSKAFGAPEIEQRDYTITRERSGLAANFDLRLSDASLLYLHSLYSDFSDSEKRQRNEYKLDKGDLQTISSSSAAWSDARLNKSLKDRFEEQQILSLVAGGEHDLDLWGVEYALGYSHSEEAEPHRRDTDFEQRGLELGYTSAGKIPSLEIGDVDAAMNPANYVLDEIVIEDNFTDDEELSFRIDLRRDIEVAGNPSELKFGLQQRNREKTGDLNATVYSGFGGDYTLADFAMNKVDYSLMPFVGAGVDMGALNRFIDANLGNFEIEAADTALDSARDYVMSEDISALYVMNSIDFSRASLVYGVRYERTDFKAAGNRVIESNEPIAGAVEVAEDVYVSPENSASDYSHLFPSVNFKYDYNENVVLRAAYTESLSRPSFGYLNPSAKETEYDEGELKVEAGDPELDPYESQNLDFSAEYYTDDLGMFSLGLFHKRIDNFAVVADVTSTMNGDFSEYAGSLPVDDAEILRPINGDTATLNGAELSWTRAFDNGLLLRANATFTDSEARLGLGPDAGRSDKAPLPLQSDLVGNFIVGYERDAFSLRLSTSFRGERLDEVNTEDAALDKYEDDHMQVDLSAKYHFANGVQLSFSGVNLTDEPMYLHNSGFNGQYEEYGPTYVLGVTYSTF
ncbi:TonB-dependent receptor [Microbulbifer sp.]|uniref:TonB-dependent receptor n=1 Tax=Microbulbifer sp. TaxID=1908541 RepID=UPI00258C5867|nr:TonB-dependent receptor [Microbulbifer sp.]